MGKKKTPTVAPAKAKGPVGNSTPTGNIASAVPAWPAFKPPLPVKELAVETLVPEKIVVLKTFWPQSLCRDYVSFLSSLPLATTPGKPKRGEALRVNDRFQVHDDLFARRLWNETGLRDAVQDADVAQWWYESSPPYTSLHVSDKES